METTKIEFSCPYCGRKKVAVICDAVPRNRIDCAKCHATAMVKKIRNVEKGGQVVAKVWAVDWEADSRPAKRRVA